MMALTATATVSLREEASTILGMRAPMVVAVSPSKSNVTYVVKSYDSIKEAFATLQNGLMKQ